MVKQKRGSVLIWILIILMVILIAAVIGIYVFAGLKPKFPNQIGEYTLKSNEPKDESECGQIEGNNVCFQGGRIEYITLDNRAVHVILTKITSGKESYISYMRTHASELNVEGIKGVYKGEPWELFWFTNKGYDMITTQDYQYIPQPEGGYNSQLLNGTTTSSVAKWFLDKYPPADE